MKSLFSLIVVAVLLTVASCSNGSSKEDKSKIENAKAKDALMVYAFHGTRQCETCKHMKAYTKSTLDKYFKSELKSGAIVYQVVDVDNEANYKLAEKFEATGTALMIDKVKNGKDNIEDWSDFAFEYANGDQKAFELELKKMIEAQL
jgi:tRNA isopentenyl-2-thiomethyl-A-37 hydroxylase MiaE